MIETSKARNITMLCIKFIISSWMAMTFFTVGMTNMAQAATSKWQDLGGGKARLVADLDPDSGILKGAIEVRLEPGWSTYWRYPGSSGIPPRFDFSGSVNFDVGEVLFPAPKLVRYENGAYAGYKEKVIFPFTGKMTGNNDGKLNLQLLMGVCDKICIPAQAEMSIDARGLFQSDAGARKTIEFSRFFIPRKKPAEYVILALDHKQDKSLQIKVAHNSSHGEPALFVEGPQEWYLQPAKLLKQDAASATFRLDLSNLPENTDPLSQKLRFTLVTGRQGIETTR